MSLTSLQAEEAFAVKENKHTQHNTTQHNTTHTHTHTHGDIMILTVTAITSFVIRTTCLQEQLPNQKAIRINILDRLEATLPPVVTNIQPAWHHQI